ncbi:PP2C family protein-serine/threonine phosphatase [Arthrobacter sp. HLT1-20]
MSMAKHPLILRYAARSHVGMVRAKNDDSAYAGKYLAVVADGMGGHAGGDVASASTVLDLIHLDHNHHDGDAGSHLADEIQSANSLLSELVHVNPKLAGMGTTVTALLLSGDRLAYAHIGDSRAYRLKDGAFEQMSTDHTFVQRMIDEGRMTEAEAEVHPHKNVLMRVLGDVDASPELDLKYFDVTVGERWLLCSDGLNFVRHEMVEEVIKHTKSLATAADTLIELTLAAGSPDNVTVVVFDVVESVSNTTDTAALSTVGATAANDEAAPASAGDDTDLDDAGDSPEQQPAALAQSQEADDSTALEAPGEAGIGASSTGTGMEEAAGTKSGTSTDDAVALDTHIRAAAIRRELALREHELVGAAVTANAEGKIPHLPRQPATQRAATVLTHKTNTAPVLVEDTEVSLPRLRQRPWVWAIIGALTALAIVAGSWAAYAWTQTQYFVGESNGNVAIFQGVSQSLGPIQLSHLYRETGVNVDSLPSYSQQLVAQTVPASTLDSAEQIISDLQLGTGTSTPPCNLAPTSAPASSSAPSTATATPTSSPSASAKPSGTATPQAGTTATAQVTCIPGGGQ